MNIANHVTNLVPHMMINIAKPAYHDICMIIGIIKMNMYLIASLKDIIMIEKPENWLNVMKIIRNFI